MKRMLKKPSRSQSKRATLPSYKNPPLEEVVCGFRFETLPELKIPHIGLLWQKFRDEFPRIQHVPPILGEQGLVADDSTGMPLPRVWFINARDDHLIQFQVDRFYFNWRRRNNQYPRYSTIVRRFIEAKRVLEEFIDEFELGTLKPIEFELTYINHIPKGRGWETVDDLSKIFCDFGWQTRKGRFLPTPTSSAWHARFVFPEDQGTLTVKSSQGKKKEDGAPILILEMAARGRPKEFSKDAMMNWFDQAHEWIVFGFADLTTDIIQNTVWEREYASTPH
jgi:uncharacterized protein (TIGR04255 family)